MSAWRTAYSVQEIFSGPPYSGLIYLHVHAPEKCESNLDMKNKINKHVAFHYLSRLQGRSLVPYDSPCSHTAGASGAAGAASSVCGPPRYRTS